MQLRNKRKKRASNRSSMPLEPLLNPTASPARITLNEFTPPDGGWVGSSSSSAPLYRSVAQQTSPPRTTLNVATRSGRNSLPRTAPFSEAHHDISGFNHPIESRSHPLPQQPNSLKRRRSLSPAPPENPALAGHLLSERVSQRGVSTESIERTTRYAILEPPYATRDERSATADNLMALRPSEMRLAPLSGATGVTSAPGQQNALDVPCEQRGETVQRPTARAGDVQQGAHIQQDRPDDKMSGHPQQNSLAHTYDSASSSRDSVQATGGHLDDPNTLPAIGTKVELRQNSVPPDPWRLRGQYRHGKNHDNARYYGTYEPHIMENRRFVYEPDGERTLVHGICPVGPPLKPLDPPTTESIALQQQLYVLRRQEAEEYPVADISEVPRVTNGNTTLT